MAENITIAITFDNKYKVIIHQDSIWLQNEAGEGMDIPVDKLIEYLDKFWEEYF